MGNCQILHLPIYSQEPSAQFCREGFSANRAKFMNQFSDWLLIFPSQVCRFRSQTFTTFHREANEKRRNACEACTKQVSRSFSAQKVGTNFLSSCNKPGACLQDKRVEVIITPLLKPFFQFKTNRFHSRKRPGKRAGIAVLCDAMHDNR